MSFSNCFASYIFCELTSLSFEIVNLRHKCGERFRSLSLSLSEGELNDGSLWQKSPIKETIFWALLQKRPIILDLSLRVRGRERSNEQVSVCVCERERGSERDR